MKEVTLTKTVVIRNNPDQESLQSKLYNSVIKEFNSYFSLYTQIPKEQISEWLLSSNSKIALEAELKKGVKAQINIDQKIMDNFSIKCKNFLSLKTIFNEIKAIVNPENGNIEFVLFFTCQNLFYVNTIGNSLLVTPVSKPGEIYQVDMSEPDVSISYLSNLIRK